MRIFEIAMNVPGQPAPLRIIPETVVPTRSGVTVWWSNVKREGPKWQDRIKAKWQQLNAG